MRIQLLEVRILAGNTTDCFRLSRVTENLICLMAQHRRRVIFFARSVAAYIPSFPFVLFRTTTAPNLTLEVTALVQLAVSTSTPTHSRPPANADVHRKSFLVRGTFVVLSDC